MFESNGLNVGGIYTLKVYVGGMGIEDGTPCP